MQFGVDIGKIPLTADFQLATSKAPNKPLKCMVEGCKVPHIEDVMEVTNHTQARLAPPRLIGHILSNADLSHLLSRAVPSV
jgi:hypothetical protein